MIALLLLLLHMREEKIRPISARYMHKKERAYYEKIISEI